MCFTRLKFWIKWRDCFPFVSVGKWVTSRSLLGQHFIDPGRAAHRPLESRFGGFIIPIIDFLGVFGVPVNEDTNNDAQVINMLFGDDSLFDRVNYGPGYGCLGRTKHLHSLFGSLNGNLIGHNRIWLGR